MNYIDEFKTITSKMIDTYIKKNHDYGNSFDSTLDKYGLIASVVRMEDKLNRFYTLIKNNPACDESVMDTLLDLANYAIMTRIYLENTVKNVQEVKK